MHHSLILLIALLVGVIAGNAIADPIEERAERQHNLTVIATVEVAAHNYSEVDPKHIEAQLVCSMSDLDDYYR